MVHLQRFDPRWIDGDACAIIEPAGAVERQERGSTKGRRGRAGQSENEYQHDPDEAASLAASRRQASTLWQPSRAHLGADTAADHPKPASWRSMNDTSTGQAPFREIGRRDGSAEPPAVDGSRTMFATGLALVATCVALFLVWNTVSSLLLVFAGILFAAFLDAARPGAFGRSAAQPSLAADAGASAAHRPGRTWPGLGRRQTARADAPAAQGHGHPAPRPAATSSDIRRRAAWPGMGPGLCAMAVLRSKPVIQPCPDRPRRRLERSDQRARHHISRDPLCLRSRQLPRQCGRCWCGHHIARGREP